MVRKGKRTLISVVILLNLGDHQPSYDYALGEPPDSTSEAAGLARGGWGLGFRG